MDTPNELWKLLPAQVARGPLSPDRVGDLVTATLGGPVDDDTLRLLATAGRGEPALTIALVIAGRLLGVLARSGGSDADDGSDADGRWTWRHAAGVTAALDAGRITVVDLLTLPADAEPARPAQPPTQLTRREIDVLELLYEGLTARAIAHRLDLSTRTVSKYQEKLYRKLGTSDRLTTVLVAQRLGLVVSRSTNDGRHKP